MKSDLVFILAVSAVASAELTGKVGPSTSREAKAAKKVCSILEYGGVASATTDNGAAIVKAWEACKAGGQVLIPSGTYGLEKWVELSGGRSVSINLEGILSRVSNGTAEGDMIVVQNSEDVEFYSANSKGAVQGFGYEFHKQDKYGPNMLKFSSVSNFSIHDLALVDAPAVHFNLVGCTNGEVYNLVVYGGNKKGLDGIDVSGANIWVHDVEVTNGDECVTVKSPARSLQIESVFCNLSGGCSIGPSGTDANINDISYRNIYSQRCDHMMLIKSNGGSGPVGNSRFENFKGHGNNNTLQIDAFWAGQAEAPGDGVEYNELTFSNWAGTCVDGTAQPPIQFHCSPTLLCGSLLVENFNIWTETGSSELFKCQNSYGYGACMNPYAGNGAYQTTMTVKSMATAAYAISTMPAEATAGLGVTASIDIPAVPTTFYPGLKPKSSLMAKPSA